MKKRFFVIRNNAFPGRLEKSEFFGFQIIAYSWRQEKAIFSVSKNRFFDATKYRFSSVSEKSLSLGARIKEIFRDAKKTLVSKIKQIVFSWRLEKKFFSENEKTICSWRLFENRKKLLCHGALKKRLFGKRENCFSWLPEKAMFRKPKKMLSHGAK